uniref:Uncharacterized protein n=1 Tax=Podoviridae sp. ctHMt20 TaxID=2827728 RepID=A0A8S5SLJ7_9CAUD|nr:MAG TPA: hypothetical protein [Podoviridae sp. ctHMt20]
MFLSLFLGHSVKSTKYKYNNFQHVLIKLML